MFENEGRAAKAGAVGLAVRSRVVLILPRFLPESFRASAAIASESGVDHRDAVTVTVTVMQTFFSAERCRSV